MQPMILQRGTAGHTPKDQSHPGGRREPAGKADIWTSPLAVDGKVFIGTRKGLWVLAAGKVPKPLAAIRLGSPIRSMPVVGDGTLFVASQRYLWAVGDSRLSNASALAAMSGTGRPSAAHPAAAAAQQSREHTL